MAAFVAKQMVGNKLNAVKGESTRLSFFIRTILNILVRLASQRTFVVVYKNTMNNDDSFIFKIMHQ